MPKLFSAIQTYSPLSSGNASEILRDASFPTRIKDKVFEFDSSTLLRIQRKIIGSVP